MAQGWSAAARWIRGTLSFQSVQNAWRQESLELVSNSTITERHSGTHKRFCGYAFRKIPFILMTNGGGALEGLRARLLSRQLDYPVSVQINCFSRRNRNLLYSLRFRRNNCSNPTLYWSPSRLMLLEGRVALMTISLWWEELETRLELLPKGEQVYGSPYMKWSWYISTQATALPTFILPLIYCNGIHRAVSSALYEMQV